MISETLTPDGIFEYPEVRVGDIIGDEPEIAYQSVAQFLGSAVFRVMRGKNEDFAGRVEWTYDFTGEDYHDQSPDALVDVALDSARSFLEKVAPLTYWWLNADRQSALADGTVTEQLSVKSPISESNIYNFSDTALSDVHARSMCNVLNAIFCSASIADKQVPILLSNDIPGNINKYTELPVRGHYYKYGIHPFIPETFCHIEIFNEGRFRTERDLPNMNPLELLTAHEIAHALGHDPEEDTDGSQDEKWLEVAGWKTIDGEPHKTYQKDTWYLDEPERAPDRDLARSNPEDDFADSFATLILDPHSLDPARRDYLIERFYEGVSMPLDYAAPEVTRKTGSAIEIPQAGPYEYVIQVKS